MEEITLDQLRKKGRDYGHARKKVEVKRRNLKRFEREEEKPLLDYIQGLQNYLRVN